MLASVAGAQLGLRAPAPVRAGRAGPVAVAASQSRIGKQPVKIPSGVTVKVDKGVVGVKVGRASVAASPRSPPRTSLICRTASMPVRRD